MTDLNSLILPGSGFVLNNAYDISDTGYIVGDGTLNGVDTAFLLTPTAVPEPGSIVLFGVGLAAGIGLYFRRRFQSA